MTGMLFDNIDRNGNGVKVRKDGRGDAWSNEHRIALGNKFFMQDLDALFGQITFGHNTGERLFLEYVPDDYENRFNVIRDMAFIATFDRKSTEGAAFASENVVSTAVYLNLCRQISDRQPRQMKFFYVIGKAAPWRMIEIDIYSGERLPELPPIKNKDDWRRVWENTDLIEARDFLSKWLHSQSRQAKECSNVSSVEAATG